MAEYTFKVKAGKLQSTMPSINTNHPKIVIANGRVTFHNAEARVREYCKLEVYDGYDNFHSVDNTITQEDIDATKRIFSMIDQHGNGEGIAILDSSEIAGLLSRIPDLELGEIDDSRWEDLKKDISMLFNAFLKIKSVGLAKTVKILHLKRPHLFPILDSYVVHLLTGINPTNQNVVKSARYSLGIQALENARNDIIANREAFGELPHCLKDLPIPLTTVRMYDILCWTYWKWDHLGNRMTTKWVPVANGEYKQERNHVSETLLGKVALTKVEETKKLISSNPTPREPKQAEIMIADRSCIEIDAIDQFTLLTSKTDGFIVVTDMANGNRLHKPWCGWLKKEHFIKKVIENRKTNGQYYWCKDYNYAETRFHTASCKTCMI